MTGYGVANVGWMPPALTPRSRWYVIAVASTAALAFGILLPIQPRAAIGAIVVIPLALATPVAALSVLVAVTVLAPFALQDTFKVIGGRDDPGLLLVDAVMLAGLLRVGLLLVRRRLRMDVQLLAGIAVGLICAAALIWGIARGAAVNEAGHEARRMVLGVGTFLLAWPLMSNRSARRRLVWVLIGIGFVLAVWGLAQWAFSIGYTTQGDIGVRPGVDLTSSGRGQLQGGMYAYPIAVTLAWAALVSGLVRDVAAKWLVAAVLFLNAVCVLLTYERTFWIATAVACALVVMTSGSPARRLSIKWAGLGVAGVVGLVAIAPGEARTALERLFSVEQVAADNSFTSRVFESRAVTAAIAQRPVTGSGFGATVTWGVRDTFGTNTTSFSHNGYLWLAWKIGLPAATFVVLVVGRAVVRRTPSGDTLEWRALRKGSQASLLALLLICFTFPAFDALGITAVMGLLVAVCYSGAGPPASPPPSRWLR